MSESAIDPKELIMLAAQHIFARYGFKKATIDEIAKAAHKAKSSIYHYFDSKEDIFREILEKESVQLNQEIMNAVRVADTPQTKINAYVITRMQTLQSLINYYGALKDDYLENYSFIEKIRKKQDDTEKSIIKSILKEGVDIGIFTIKNLDVTAFAIFTALKGLEYSWLTEKDSNEIKEHIANLLEILFYGIETR